MPTKKAQTKIKHKNSSTTATRADPTALAETRAKILSKKRSLAQFEEGNGDGVVVGEGKENQPPESTQKSPSQIVPVVPKSKLFQKRIKCE